MKMITKIIEPKKLYFIWKSNTDPSVNCKVGEIELKNGRYVLRYLTDDPDFKLAQKKGFVGYPGFKVSLKEHQDNILETFRKRLPNRSRSDFKDYLRAHKISSDVEVSDFALLGYTGGKLPSDGFSFLHPFEDAKAPFSFIIEASGVRHFKENTSGLKLGENICLEKEPNNKHDPNALKLTYKGQCVGYINRCQTSIFRQFIDTSTFRITVDRLNGSAERPRLFLFVEVNS